MLPSEGMLPPLNPVPDPLGTIANPLRVGSLEQSRNLLDRSAQRRPPLAFVDSMAVPSKEYGTRSSATRQNGIRRKDPGQDFNKVDLVCHREVIAIPSRLPTKEYFPRTSPLPRSGNLQLK